jgi:hypothetical protein
LNVGGIYSASAASVTIEATGIGMAIPARPDIGGISKRITIQPGK